MPRVVSAGPDSPRSAASAIASPAPKNRYHSAPPMMQATCSTAAASVNPPPMVNQTEPGLRATRPIIALECDLIRSRRLGRDIFFGNAGGEFDQLERAVVVVAFEHREIGDDHIDDILAG